MTLITKLLLGTTGAGSLAVGGYGVYELVRPKTIGQQLVWEGYVLGYVGDDPNHEDNGGEGLWHKLFTKYSSSEVTANTDKFKKVENETTVPEITDKNSLKQRCKKVFDFSVSDSENLKQARFWCIHKSSKLNEQ